MNVEKVFSDWCGLYLLPAKVEDLLIPPDGATKQVSHAYTLQSYYRTVHHFREAKMTRFFINEIENIN